jgi:hypothetical protein
MSAFPGARAQGTEAAQPSCASPTGTPGEDRVDCAAAGLEPLAAELFEAPRECGEAGCGISQCCVAAGCHDAPGWTTSALNRQAYVYGADCDYVARNGHCASTESRFCTSAAGGLCPA